MESLKMSFQEIKSNKEQFLRNYDLIKDFAKYEKLNGSWDELLEIGTAYEEKLKEYYNKIQEFIKEISQFQSVHSYRYRLKKTDSLLKKIITKSVKKNKLINKQNYLQEITDLLGIRILYIFKEDCFAVHQQIMQKFGNQTAEHVCIKLRTGDDEKYYSEIMQTGRAFVERDNIYRSIHYTLYSNQKDTKDAKIEIQTRTIFEEGWSEINHKLVYKNIADKYAVLKSASDVLNSLVGDCDKIGSMMKTLYDEYINKMDNSEKKLASDNSGEITAKTVGEVFNIFLNS